MAAAVYSSIDLDNQTKVLSPYREQQLIVFCVPQCFRNDAGSPFPSQSTLPFEFGIRQPCPTSNAISACANSWLHVAQSDRINEKDSSKRSHFPACSAGSMPLAPLGLTLNIKFSNPARTASKKFKQAARHTQRRQELEEAQVAVHLQDCLPSGNPPRPAKP